MLSQTLPLCNSYLNNFRGDTNSMKLFAKHTDCSQHSHECCNSPNTMKSISISHTLSLRESDSQAISPHPHFFYFLTSCSADPFFPFTWKYCPAFGPTEYIIFHERVTSYSKQVFCGTSVLARARNNVHGRYAWQKWSSTSRGPNLWLQRMSLLAWGAGIAQWVECQTRDQKVLGSSPCRSGQQIFFHKVNFLCWLIFSMCSTPVLLQLHVQDPSHSAKSAGGRLQLSTHARYLCGFEWSDTVNWCMVGVHITVSTPLLWILKISL